MLLVVMGHVMMMCGLDISETTLYAIIGTFNMPLFFLISGYFAYKPIFYWTAGKLTRHLRLKTSSLVLCTLVFYALLYHTRNQEIFGWIDKGFGAYWFTVTLFEIFVTYYVSILISMVIRHDLILPFNVVVAIASLVLMLWNPFAGQRWWKVAGGANYCLYLQYFSLGLIFNRYKDLFMRILTDGSAIGLSMAVYVALLCFLYTPSEQYGLIGKIYKVFALPYAGLWMVTSLFLVAKDYFDKNNYISDNLCLIGRRSLDIYMIHYFFLPPLAFMQDLIASNSMILFQLFVSIGVAVPIISLSILVGASIRKSDILAEILFGTKRVRLL